jgi:hypothetical protein
MLNWEAAFRRYVSSAKRISMTLTLRTTRLVMAAVLTASTVFAQRQTQPATPLLPGQTADPFPQPIAGRNATEVIATLIELSLAMTGAALAGSVEGVITARVLMRLIASSLWWCRQ